MSQMQCHSCLNFPATEIASMIGPLAVKLYNHHFKLIHMDVECV